jgi:uncharacterized SAM-binding protein YcdF (DUF218 family)
VSGERGAFFGVFTRKERWGLSAQGWLVSFTAAALVAIVTVVRVYPFLAVTHRVDADVLVVEGWIHQHAIRSAVKEFRTGVYRQVFATGGPVQGSGGYTSDYNTSASVGADLLRKEGLIGECVKMVPSRINGRDRTYSSAVALRNWVREHGFPIHGINVVTEDLHARRTRLLFERALGPGIRVGIIAVPSADYDAQHWWRYTGAVKDVIAEGAGYLYARFLFHPTAD